MSSGDWGMRHPVARGIHRRDDDVPLAPHAVDDGERIFRVHARAHALPSATTMAPARFALERRAIVRSDHLELIGMRDQLIVDLPGVEHGLREHQARIAGQRRLIEIAAISNDAEQRQLPVVHRVAQGVARFEQSRALNHDHRARAAEIKAGGNLPCFAFATYTDDARGAARFDRGLPLADRAVRHGHNVGDPELLEQLGDLVQRA